MFIPHHIHLIFTLIYLTFLVSFSLIILLHQNCLVDKEHNKQVIHDLVIDCDPNVFQIKLYLYFKENHIFSVLSCFCICISLFGLIKDLYWRIEVNIQTVLGIILRLVAVPFLIGKVFYELEIQWGLESVVMFLAWFNLLLVMQRFQVFGIYVIMFTEILKTLFKVILLFSIHEHYTCEG